MDYNRFKNLVPQSLLDAVSEALKGGQKKLDVDGDGKLEKSDFEKLRKNKKHEAGESKAQEKAEDMKEAAKDDEPPSEGPYKKTGERKDEYGNKIKNVAKHLARKAMNKKANEGYVPTGDEPSDVDKKTAQKVRGLLSKEKKGKWKDVSYKTPDGKWATKSVKEEVEDLEESYEELKRLKGNIERNEKKMKAIPGIHPEKKRLATQIEKDTKKHKEIFNKYWGKNEEVEQIDELDQNVGGVLSKFINKTAGDKNRKVAHNLAIKKRGGDAANTPEPKVKAVVREEVELEEENVLIHAPGNKHHGKQARVFHKHDDGRVNVQLKHSSKKGDVSNFTLQPHQFTPLSVKEEVEQIDELSKKALGGYVKAASHDVATRASATARYAEKEDQARKAGDIDSARKNSKIADKAFNKGWKRRQHIAKAVDKLTAEAATPGVAAGSLPNGEHMCATNIMHKEWKEGTPIPTMHADPDANGLIEWYDVMFEHGIERVMTEDMEILQAESHMHSKKKMKKEEVDLDEARGRGRPSAASKAEEDEPLALGMQLRKAKSINKPVTFANKETKEVHPSHVTAFNDHMDARRTTQEKAAFQKRAHASHAEFVKAVSEKVPTKAKDTGEIVKYR